MQLVDNKRIAAKIMANTPAFSIHKNGVARKMRTAANKRVANVPQRNVAFKPFSLYTIHSIWLVASEFFCFCLFSLNEQLVKSELMKLAYLSKVCKTLPGVSIFATFETEGIWHIRLC